MREFSASLPRRPQCFAPLYETTFSGEIKAVNTRVRIATSLAALLLSATGVFAGGSGLNVVVVVNQNSTNSVQLGNYYCEKRGVPPQNVLRITNWTGGNVEWTTSDLPIHCLIHCWPCFPAVV